MKAYGVAPMRGIDNGVTANKATATYKARGESAAAVRLIKTTRISIKDSEAKLEKDPNGTPNGVTVTEDMDEIVWEAVIQADTKAHAIAEANLPIKPSVVTLAEYVDHLHTFLNGDWAYLGGGEYDMAEGEDEDHKIKLPLKRFRKPDGTLVPLTGTGGILVAVA
jgi:hypothetical protein